MTAPRAMPEEEPIGRPAAGLYPPGVYPPVAYPVSAVPSGQPAGYAGAQPPLAAPGAPQPVNLGVGHVTGEPSTHRQAEPGSVPQQAYRAAAAHQADAQQRVAAARATQGVRATATVPPPRRPPESVPTPPSVPVAESGRRLHFIQVACWQVAVVMVLVAAGGPLPVLIAVSVSAGLLVGVTASWWRGRWLYQWMHVRAAYGMRRRRLTPGDLGPAGTGDIDPRRALIEFLQPGATLGELGLDEGTVATLAHPAGLTAVLELEPGDRTLFAPANRVLPTPVSLLPAPEPHLPPTTVQLITQVEPPPVELPGAGLATAAYRQATGGLVPARRRAWPAVQARRTPEVYSDAALRPALRGAIKRVQRRLRRDGVAAQPLGTDALLAACATVAGMAEGNPGQVGVYGRRLDRDLGRETWSGWTAGDLVQTSYRITTWPSGAWTPAGLLNSLPATTVTLAVSALRNPAAGENDPIELELVLRLAAPDAAGLSAAGARLAEMIGDIGGAVERLDGRHRAAVNATMPFGGFVS
jgi:type VII secretion protein EccE